MRFVISIIIWTILTLVLIFGMFTSTVYALLIISWFISLFSILLEFG